MAARVEEGDVRAIIQNDSLLSIAPFIATATALTDYVESKDSNSLLTSALLVEIEKYLAAHFYEHKDQQYSNKKTGDASAAFQGQFGLRLDGSKWGQTALTLDVTGTLASLNKARSKATASWAGRKKSEQTDYADRD